MDSDIQLSFEQLNQFILAYFENNDESSLMRDVKLNFSSFINSKRKLESIRNVDDLLKLLKRKGLYDPHDRKSLRIFSKTIIDENFEKMVEAHNALLNKLPHLDEENSSTNKYGKLIN